MASFPGQCFKCFLSHNNTIDLYILQLLYYNYHLILNRPLSCDIIIMSSSFEELFRILEPLFVCTLTKENVDYLASALRTDGFISEGRLTHLLHMLFSKMCNFG